MAKRHSNKIGDLESLFLRLEELVLANSGEDEFEEIFKLLIAKICDEQSCNTMRFKRLKDSHATYDSIVTLLNEVELKWPGIIDIGTIPRLTPEHLEVCVEALSHHNISARGLSAMDGFFEFLVSRAAKGAKGQYFTPRHIVEFCVRMVAPKCNESVVDPACGSGGFLIHTLSYVREREKLKGVALQKYCSGNLWGFDIDARAIKVAKALMVLAGDGHSNVIRLNSLIKPNTDSLWDLNRGEALEIDGAPRLTVEDVCRSRIRKHKGFDVLLTNPPFAGEIRERQLLDAYSLGNGKVRVERDILFLERCVDLVRPGGRIAIVLPHNKFAAGNFEGARNWLMQHCRVVGVVSLGRNTFLPHTHQKTCVLFARKRLSGERPVANEKIFFGISERDGKNSKGQLVLLPGHKAMEGLWECIDHDLTPLVNDFMEFCGKEKAWEAA